MTPSRDPIVKGLTEAERSLPVARFFSELRWTPDANAALGSWPVRELFDRLVR